MSEHDAQYDADMAASKAIYEADIARSNAIYRADMKRALTQFVTTVLGGTAGGTTFIYAVMGTLPWWYAALIIAAIITPTILAGRQEPA